MVRKREPDTSSPAKSTPAVVMAYGEAGCAVVARAFGLGVTCEPSDGGVARLVSARNFISRDADAATKIAALANDAKVMLARLVATVRADSGLTVDKLVETHPDVAFVWTMALHMVMLKAGDDWTPEKSDEAAEVYGDEADEMFAQLMIETMRLCDEHWPTIERVATVLVERDYLDPVELDRIIGVLHDPH